MTTPEFSRLVDPRHLPDGTVELTASAEERRALCERFGLIAIDTLEARMELEGGEKAVQARGTLRADLVQSCAVTGDDLPMHIEEKLSLRFVPDIPVTEEEVEIAADDCDEVSYAGDRFDLGEAVAQSLALAIDPFATGPDADRFRAETGLSEEAPTGPFAALDALRKK